MKSPRISLLVALLSCAAAVAQTQGPALTVNAKSQRHPISPDVYGINNYSSDLSIFTQMGASVQRWGGDATSLYNWQVDSSNAGLDWFYIGGSGTPQSQVVPGQSVDTMLSFDVANRAKSVVTIPITGWVNKYSEWNCSFPENLYPDQGIQWGWTAFWPYLTDETPTVANGYECGSGLSPADDGTQIVQTDPLRNHLAVNPAWMKQWIAHLMKTNGKQRPPVGLIYQMDNEPESWNYIHHDIYPGDISYDELVNDTIAYASMIKHTDPHGRVLGPSNCCIWSEWDLSSTFIGDDGVANPFPPPYNQPWYGYYLSQMKQYEKRNHTRILDYFDFHFYPEVDGVSIANSPAGDDLTKAARLRSTRALWDPTYITEDWMGTYFPTTYGTPMLVRNMRAWVKQYYPGTKTAITEYNWGGLEDINGALAQADVLGIFGREGLDLATLWGPPTADQPGAFAFTMYRNYDGHGSQFGDISISSQSADQSQLGIYAAEHSDIGTLTVIVINKTDSDLTSTVTIQGYESHYPTAGVYQYSCANLAAITQQPAVPVSWQRADHEGMRDGMISYIFPANSITLFVLQRAHM